MREEVKDRLFLVLGNWWTEAPAEAIKKKKEGELDWRE